MSADEDPLARLVAEGVLEPPTCDIRDLPPPLELPGEDQSAGA